MDLSLIKSVLENKLHDPSSTQYKIDYVTEMSGSSNMNDSFTTVCGRLNSKNLIGAYVGYKEFWVGPFKHEEKIEKMDEVDSGWVQNDIDRVVFDHRCVKMKEEYDSARRL